MMLTLTNSKMKIDIYIFVLIGYHFVRASVVELRQTARPGRRVELKCDTTVISRDLLWFKKNRENDEARRLIDGVRGVERDSNGHEDILILTDPEYSDKGIYILRRIRGRKQRDICKITLDILRPLEARCNYSEHMPVTEHMNVTLTCRTNADNLTNVTWYRLNTQGQKTNLSNTFELTLPSVSRYATGKYVCIVQRNKETDSCEVKVDVEFKPEIELYETEIKLRETKDTKLMCRVSANPMSRVVWTKGNSAEALYQNSWYDIEEDETLLETHYTKYVILTLKAVSLKEKMFGNYTCQITGYAGDEYSKKVNVIKVED